MSFNRISQWVECLKETGPAKLPPKVRKSPGKMQGLHTGLPMNRWLALVFEWNELRCIRYCFDEAAKPLTDYQIFENFKIEFQTDKDEVSPRGLVRGGSLLSHKHGIGFQRGRFNRGTLFSKQEKPFLISLPYHSSGHITSKSGIRERNIFPTLSECQQICINYKIADPRFFSIEDLEKIEQHARSKGVYDSWTIPTKEELEELNSFAPINLYRCCKTYDLWKSDKYGSKKHTLKTKTVKEVNTQIEQEHKDWKADMERQRQETQAVINSLNYHLEARKPTYKEKKKQEALERRQEALDQRGEEIIKSLDGEIR